MQQFVAGLVIALLVVMPIAGLFLRKKGSKISGSKNEITTFQILLLLNKLCMNKIPHKRIYITISSGRV